MSEQKRYAWFWDVASRLKNRYPLRHPLNIRTAKRYSHLGTASVVGTGNNKRFLIVVERGEVNAMALVLIEEYAHCMTWYSKDSHDHGEKWQRTHGKLRKWYEEICKS